MPDRPADPGLDADLATVRDVLAATRRVGELREALTALDRVEAEIARLTQERDEQATLAETRRISRQQYQERAEAAEAEVARLERENEHLHLRIQRKNERLNAAEAEVARLRDGLRPFVEDYRTVESLIEDQRKARALLAEDGAR